jgi:hypothetical protein
MDAVVDGFHFIRGDDPCFAVPFNSDTGILTGKHEDMKYMKGNKGKVGSNT